MPRLLRRLIVLVAVVAVLLLAVDRVGAYAVSQLAARNARNGGADSATVRILGFPFLTQVGRGDLTHVTVTERGLTAGALRIDSLHAAAHGVHVSFADAVRGRVGSVPVDDVSGAAVISYASLSSGITRSIGLDAVLRLTFTPVDAGDVQATLTGPLGLHVSVTLPVPTAVDGRLQLGAFVQRFAPELPDGVATGLTLPLPGLPYGLRLGSATAAADGVHLALTGRDVSFGG